MRVIFVIIIAALLWFVPALYPRAFAQGEPEGGKILGLSHVAMNAGDVALDRVFYENILGFGSPFSLKHPDGTEWIVNIKVNDEQFLELFAGSNKNDGPLNHFALYTDDARRLADRIKARGVQLVAELHRGQTGNDFFALRDPDGHLIEIVEYVPSGRTVQDRGLFLPPNRASNHILAVGLSVRSSTLSKKFYTDVLGFREVTRPPLSQRDAGSIHMCVRDGDDELHLLVSPQPAASGQPPSNEYVSLTDTRSLELSGSQTQDLFDPGGMRIEMRRTIPVSHETTFVKTTKP
jgi:catechol 2,3-dioxygenase-like lactoylglutathione lyase family enzyme